MVKFYKTYTFFYKTDYLDNISQIYINYRSWFFIRLGFIRHGSDPMDQPKSSHFQISALLTSISKIHLELLVEAVWWHLKTNPKYVTGILMCYLYIHCFKHKSSIQNKLK